MKSSSSAQSERHEKFDQDPHKIGRRNDEKASMKTFDVKPCDICGDVGWQHLLATCSRCHISCKHLYCMQVLQKRLPNSWHCEACQSQSSREASTFTSSHLCEPKNQNAMATDGGMLVETVERDKIKNLPRAAKSLSRYNPSVTGKVKFIPTEDALMLHSGGTPKASAIVGGSSSQPGLRHGSFGASHHRSARRTPVCPFTSSRSLLKKGPTHVSSHLPKPPTGVTSEFYIRKSVSQPLALPSQKLAHASDSPRKRKREEDKASAKLDFQGKNMVKEDRRPSIILDSPRITKKDEDIRPSLEVDFRGKKNWALASDSPRKKKMEEHKPRTKLDSQGKNIVKEDRRPGIVLDSQRITKKHEDGRPKHHIGISSFASKDKSNASGTLEFDKSNGEQHFAIPNTSLGTKGTADSIFPCTIAGTWNSKLLVMFPEDILNPPAVHATWKGSFEVVYEDCPSELYAGLWAHPPGIISQKAYEVSKQMHEMLQFKLRPRCEQWPDIFQKDAPSNFDIALYFFPGDFSKSKEKYSRLVELIDKGDLVMQCCMDNVELLIFSSRQLPMDSQRLNTQFYLWGVFRAVNVTCRHNQNMVVDMEIDMMGGKDVGRVDKPVKKSQSMKQKEFQSNLHMEDKEKTITSHDLSREKKSNEPFERGGKKGDVGSLGMTCGIGGHASKSSMNVNFNRREKRTPIQKVSVLEPFKDVKKEQIM